MYISHYCVTFYYIFCKSKCLVVQKKRCKHHYKFWVKSCKQHILQQLAMYCSICQEVYILWYETKWYITWHLWLLHTFHHHQKGTIYKKKCFKLLWAKEEKVLHTIYVYNGDKVFSFWLWFVMSFLVSFTQSPQYIGMGFIPEKKFPKIETINGFGFWIGTAQNQSQTYHTQNLYLSGKLLKLESLFARVVTSFSDFR